MIDVRTVSQHIGDRVRFDHPIQVATGVIVGSSPHRNKVVVQYDGEPEPLHSDAKYLTLIKPLD